MSADSHLNPETNKFGICSKESNIFTAMIKQENVNIKIENDNEEYNEFLGNDREIEHMNYEIPVEDLILKPVKQEPSALPIKNEDSSYENTSKYNLLQQALVSHGVKNIEDQKQFGTKDFNGLVKKLKHSRRPEKIGEYKCDECGRILKRKTGLRHHMVGHTPSKQKLFSCDLCDKLFNAKSSLLRHDLIHKGIKKYTCDFCNRSFTRKSSLPPHFEIHSDRNSIIGYDCPVCGFSGKQKRNLSKHMLTHTEIRPYTCHICGSSFKANNVLTRHMQKHSGEKCYKCFLCYKSFSRKSVLLRHIQIHCSKDSFCNICNQSFNERTEHLSHYLTHFDI